MPPLNEDHFGVLLAAFFAALFYGLYLVTFLLYIQSLALMRRVTASASKPTAISRVLPGVSFLLALVTTAEVANALVYAVYVLSIYLRSDDVPGRITKISELVSLCDLFVATSLADSILVYRCWTVYARSWRVILLPLLTTFSGVAAFCVLLYINAPLESFASQRLDVTVAGAIAWISTLLTNLITTGLLVWKIRQATHRNARTTTTTTYNAQTPLSRVSRIIVESGILTTAFTTTTAAIYLFAPAYTVVFASVEVQVIGISFTLIAYRVNKERTVDLPPPPRVPSSGNIETLHFYHSARTATDVETGFSGTDVDMDSHAGGSARKHKTSLQHTGSLLHELTPPT